MIKGAIRNIEHHILDGTVELSVIVPLPVERELTTKELKAREELQKLQRSLNARSDKRRKELEGEIRKAAAKEAREIEVALEKLLKSIRLGAVEVGYIVDKAEARRLISQCGGEAELEVAGAG